MEKYDIHVPNHQAVTYARGVQGWSNPKWQDEGSPGTWESACCCWNDLRPVAWPKRPSRSTKKNWPWRLTMIYWYIMVYHDILWYIMVYYGTLWYMIYHDHSMIILWKCSEPGRTWKPKVPKASRIVRFRRFAQLWQHLDGELLPTFVHGQLEHVNGNGWMDFNNTQNQAKDTYPEVAAKEILLNCWIAKICWRTMQHEGARWFEIFDVRGLRPWSSGDSGCPLANFWTSTVCVPSYRTSAAQPQLVITCGSPVEQIFLGEKTSSLGPCQYVKLLPQV